MQPPNLVEVVGPSSIWELRSALYGSQNAGREGHPLIRELIVRLEIKYSVSHKGVFIRMEMLIILYVENLSVASNITEKCDKLPDDLCKEVDLKTLSRKSARFNSREAKPATVRTEENASYRELLGCDNRLLG